MLKIVFGLVRNPSYKIYGDDENSIIKRFVNDLLLCYMKGKTNY